jgi:hypothetical protein
MPSRLYIRSRGNGRRPPPAQQTVIATVLVCRRSGLRVTSLRPCRSRQAEDVSQRPICGSSLFRRPACAPLTLDGGQSRNPAPRAPRDGPLVPPSAPVQPQRVGPHPMGLMVIVPVAKKAFRTYRKHAQRKRTLDKLRPGGGGGATTAPVLCAGCQRRVARGATSPARAVRGARPASPRSPHGLATRKGHSPLKAISRPAFMRGGGRA